VAQLSSLPFLLLSVMATTVRSVFIHLFYVFLPKSCTRHEFYETDDKLTVTVFDRGADPAHVNVEFQPRGVCFSAHSVQLNNQC
jgi:hypothetical protein